MIKGIAIKLYQKTEIGVDEFNHPVYEEAEVIVENVLIAPSTTEEILDSQNLTGRRAVYTLGIPKGDTHDWTNVAVSFFGRRFRTIGSPMEGIEELIPLSWNKKVRVEAIDE